MEKITQELLTNLEYTTFLKIPITQNEVDYNIMSREVMDTTRPGRLNYSRAICSLYLPAMATALDLHIRVLQNISGYYAVLNTLPSKTEKPEKRMKKVTLVLEDNRYNPVVYITNDGEITSQDASEDDNNQEEIEVIAEIESSGSTVQIVGYSPPPQQDVIVIPETDEEDYLEDIPPTSPSPPKRNPLPPAAPVRPPNVRRGPARRHSRRLFKPQKSQLEKDLDVFMENLENQEKESIKNMEAVTLPTLPEVHQYEKKKMAFDMSPFKGMLPDVVDHIPNDVDGTKFYIIDVPEGDHFCTKYKDGRYFVMNTSKRKGFRGVRRVGKCKGNFICNNNSCPFYKQEKSGTSNNSKSLAPTSSAFHVNAWLIGLNVLQ